MKLFQERQLKKAYEYARTGGQALHLFSDPGIYPGAPNCFKRSRQAAHLFDYNIGRLIKTARRLGVRVIKIGRKGRPGQHIAAMAMALFHRQSRRKKEEAQQNLLSLACK